MSKLSVAVCDENQSYGERVGTWLFVERGTDFCGGFFSSSEIFKEQYEKQSFQVVLLGRALLSEAWIQKEIKQRKDILWIYLREEGETDVNIFPEKLPAVEKYQPVSVMIRSIYRYYEEYRKEDIGILGEDVRFLGWYSPEQSIWQTPLAMTMAALLAEKEKVLYVSLKECSGLEQWFQEEYEKDLLDMMYFCREREQKTSIELGGFVHAMEQLDYLAPVRDGTLLGELEKEDYSALMELLKRTSYDVIMLDMGSMFPGFFRIWNQCRHIYIPREQNVLARGIAKEFEGMVRRQRNPELEEKISWLTLPEWSRESFMPGCLMQQWLWGEQGDYVRELLDGRSRRD